MKSLRESLRFFTRRNVVKKIRYLPLGNPSLAVMRGTLKPMNQTKNCVNSLSFL